MSKSLHRKGNCNDLDKLYFINTSMSLGAGLGNVFSVYLLCPPQVGRSRKEIHSQVSKSHIIFHTVDTSRTLHVVMRVPVVIMVVLKHTKNNLRQLESRCSQQTVKKSASLFPYLNNVVVTALLYGQSILSTSIHSASWIQACHSKL